MAEEEDGVAYDWRKSPPEVKRIFYKDAKDGFWDKEAFAQLMTAMDPQIEDEAIDKEFQIADTEKAGKLSYDDFYTYFVNWETLVEDSKDAVDMKGKLANSAVYVRIRPLASSGGHADAGGGEYTFDGFDEKTNEIRMSHRGRPNKFSYAKKVLCECTQKEMYDATMPDLVNSFLLRQMDVMFLAYGQTGTGKTHTMFGPPASLEAESCPADGTHPDWGIFPRIVEYTLSTVASALGTQMASTLNHRICLSALEFYMMGTFDLLNNQAPVFIEDGVPVGTTERECLTMKDVCVFLKEVYGNRHVRKTKMNEGSSRSHTALVLRCYFCDSKDGDYINNTFTFFDLAGAEKVGKTGGEFISPMDALTMVMKGKDPGIAGEGAIINLDLSSMMDQVQKATIAAEKKQIYKVGKACITPAIQTISSCFDGRALMGMVVCISQADSNGSETWFSNKMGEKLAALRSPVKARKIKKIDKVIKDREALMKKTEKNLKDKPNHKFAVGWGAQVKALTQEIALLKELSAYDPAKDQVSIFVRKKLGLYADLEGASTSDQKAKVREAFEEADTDGNKTLCLKEVKAVFMNLPNNNLMEEHIEGLFKQMDKDGSGTITFDEFFDYLFP